MKLIARYLNLIGLFLLATFATAAAALYFHVPERIQASRATASPAVPKSERHSGGCCGDKKVAAEPPPAATCPHLAAQTSPAASCCPPPANP